MSCLLCHGSRLYCLTINCLTIGSHFRNRRCCMRGMRLFCWQRIPLSCTTCFATPGASCWRWKTMEEVDFVYYIAYNVLRLMVRASGIDGYSSIIIVNIIIPVINYNPFGEWWWNCIPFQTITLSTPMTGVWSCCSRVFVSNSLNGSRKPRGAFRASLTGYEISSIC